MIEPRKLSNTNIFYVLITKESGDRLPFVPEEFNNIALDLLRQWPRDIIQFFIPEEDYKARIKLKRVESVNFKVVYTRDIEMFLEEVSDIKLIFVFIVNDIDKEKLSQISKRLEIFYLTSSFSEKVELLRNYFPEKTNCIFEGSEQYFNYLARDKERIFKSLTLKHDTSLYDKLISKLYHSSDNKKELIDDLPNFNPVHSNFFMYNQIFGHYWHRKTKTVDVEMNLRSKTIVDTSQAIDTIHLILYKTGHIKKIFPIDPTYPSLILIFPYHNPLYPKIIENSTRSNGNFKNIEDFNNE